jgi:hypothetical protein
MRGFLKRLRPDEKDESLTLFSLQRKQILEQVRDALSVKLYAKFVDNDSPGRKLQAQLEKSIQENFLAPQAPSLGWMRQLPQCIRSKGSRSVFAASRTLSLEHSDTVTNSAIVREFSEYHDALAAYDVANRSARTALGRLVPQWESSASRVLLRCLCSAGTKLSAPLKQLKQPNDLHSVAFSSLVLALPSDIRSVMMVTSVTERATRWLALVADRLNRATKNDDNAKTLWDALAVRNADEDVAAARVFATLWARELVDLHQITPYGEREQVEIMQSAARRAAVRLSALGEWMLAVTQNPEVGVPMRGDATFLATQPGRDAALLLDELLFEAIEDVHQRRLVRPIVRAMAQAANRVATTFERNIPTTLPHESVASLFGSPLEGLAATLRVSDVCNQLAFPPASPLLYQLKSASAAAYPSNLLLTDSYRKGTFTDRDGDIAKARMIVAQRPLQDAYTMQSTAELIVALRDRAAALRVEGVDLADATREKAPTVADLSKLLGSLELTPKARFYVPFAYGGKPPRSLIFPPIGEPMVGTVPVYGALLANAFETLVKALDGKGAGAGASTGLKTTLIPIIGCASAESGPENLDAPESTHPMLMRVSKSGTDLDVRFHASEGLQPSPATAAPAVPPVQATGPEMAKEFIENAASRRLRTDVCSIAWNAERIHQALLLAVACAPNGTSMTSIDVDAAMPPDQPFQSKSYLEETQTPAALQEQRRLVRLATLVRSELIHYARTHYAALRRLVWKILYRFQYDDEPSANQQPSDADIVIINQITSPKPKELKTDDECLQWALTMNDIQSDAMQNVVQIIPTWLQDVLDAETERIERVQEAEPQGLEGVTSQTDRLKKIMAGASKRAEIRDTVIANESNATALLLQNATARLERVTDALSTLMETVPGYATAKDKEFVKLQKLQQTLNMPTPALTASSRAVELVKAKGNWMRQHLVLSMGLGMAMTSECIPALPIRMGAITGMSPAETKNAVGRARRLALAFKSVEALRYAEVCSIIRAVARS